MTAQRLHPDSDSFELIANHLRAGECVALPTETVYGLAGDALNPKAAQKIFSIKGRPLIDPLIVHVLDQSQAEVVAVLSTDAKLLMKVFWPGPLTMVLPKTKQVPDLITSGLNTVAIRSPSHPVFRSVLKESGLCLAAPSANPFGYISPTRSNHVLEHLGTRLDYVLDGGPCEHGVESTIIDLSSEVVKILRPGPIHPDEISKVLGKPVEMNLQHAPASGDSLKAAGTLAKHYSPKTESYLVEEFERNDPEGSRVWLGRPSSEVLVSPEIKPDQYWLSEDGDFKEMLSNVYDLLHRLDSQSYKWIEIQDPGNDVEMITLRDRLKRACYQES